MQPDAAAMPAAGPVTAAAQRTTALASGFIFQFRRLFIDFLIASPA
jgi:hypothetical protein